MLSANCHAQSWKDLLGKDNISTFVDAVTGQTSTKVDLTGTWSYNSSAVEFKSENLLMKAGGMAAATMAESKLNEQLGKVGIRAGQMSFTFNADSTFVSKVGDRTLKGTYSYDSSTKRVQLKFLRLLNMYAKKLQSRLHETAVQLGQTTETDDLHRKQYEQHRNKKRQFDGKALRRNDAWIRHEKINRKVLFKSI